MVVSFASRRLIFVTAAPALMLGADVGTTLAAQVLSFDLGWVSPAWSPSCRARTGDADISAGSPSASA